MSDIESDRLVSLPGLTGSPKGSQFAGYVPVVPTETGSTDDDVDKLFYWMAGPEDYQNHPVVVWTNGGPGSPSFWGIFTENGPYSIEVDGTNDNTKLVERETAWSNRVNYLVIEHPLGTTISFPKENDPDLPDTPAEGSTHYYNALANVLKRHGLVGKNLVLTGESYAGTYLPLLAKDILAGDPDIAAGLKSIMLGDAWVDPETQMRTDTEYAHKHGLISLAEKAKLDAIHTEYTNPYNGAISNDKSATANSLYGIPWKIHQLTGVYMTNIAETKDPPFAPVIAYLNREDVRTTFQAPPVDADHTVAGWGGSQHAYLTWNQSQSMLPTLEEILANTDAAIKVLVVSGLNDAKDCNFLGTEAWLNSDNFTGEQATLFKESGTANWKLKDGETGGFEQGYGDGGP